MSITVYHNPRCSKSRCALDYLNERKIDFTVVEYIKEPLTKDGLEALLRLLNILPIALIRKNEPEFKEHNSLSQISDEQAIEAMLRFPKLIERPIVVKDGKAIVARPTERIEELF
ncbi:MAG: arsenate reductase (glutaredoxin) [Flavobacteriia bacterium]|jgi:arsenate reductase|nr:arsenate reductase (glutaredoxin) [Cryomorphaceae bacterium]